LLDVRFRRRSRNCFGIARRSGRSPAALGLSASHNHQHNPADYTKATQDGREINPVPFLVLDFNGAELRILFLGIPAQPTVSKPDDADDN
jgi:hypothetical protein